jgi:hypothetical protein
MKYNLTENENATDFVVPFETNPCKIKGRSLMIKTPDYLSSYKSQTIEP